MLANVPSVQDRIPAVRLLMMMGHVLNANQDTGAMKITMNSNAQSHVHLTCTPTSNKSGVYLAILYGVLAALTRTTHVTTTKSLSVGITQTRLLA